MPQVKLRLSPTLIKIKPTSPLGIFPTPKVNAFFSLYLFPKSDLDNVSKPPKIFANAAIIVRIIPKIIVFNGTKY